MHDRAGLPATLILTANCANQRLMSLPAMIQAAPRNSHGDDWLRLVHALPAFQLELGEDPPVLSRNR